jgi:hypothetical protein
MQKLTGTSSGRITKVVGFSTMKPTKLGLNFSNFSMIFYAIYKKQPNALYYLSYQLQEGPRKEFLFCNVVPGTAGRRLGPKSGEVGAGVGGERWGKGSGPHRRPICGLVGGVRVAGRGAPRLLAATAAGVAAPVRGAAPAAHWDVEQFACEGREGTASSEDRRAAGGEFGCRPEDWGGAPLVARWCGLGAVEGRPCASRRGDGPLIVDPCAGLRPADRRRASGTRTPGDGGRTAGSCEELYGGAEHQTSRHARGHGERG